MVDLDKYKGLSRTLLGAFRLWALGQQGVEPSRG